MRLHYSDTHEHVQVGDETVTPDGLSIKIIAIYEHSGAILVEIFAAVGADLSTRWRRGATADEIGADWRGGVLLERDIARYFSKLPVSDFYTATPTGRLPDPKPEIQDLRNVTRFRGPYSPAADFSALELRVMGDASFIIPINEAARQILLDGLAALKRQLPPGPGYASEACAIQQLAARLGKV